MKWTGGTIDLSKITRMVRHIGLLSKIFITVSACTLLFCVAVGIIGLIQQQKHVSAIPAMKDAAVGLTSQFFLDMIAMELPHMQKESNKSTFSQKNVFSFLMQYLTNVNPHDPKSLLAREVPGMREDSSTLLYSSKATQSTDYPADFTPPAEVFETPSPQQTADQPPQDVKPEGTSSEKTTNGKQVVFIYHSHNRESFLPELKGRGIKSPDLAYDAEVNVTLVGKRLSDQLQKLGIGTMHSTADYPSTVKEFNFAKSYAYSSKTVKEAFAANPDLKMVFDIHRDALDRERTTIDIDGKDYAQVYFVVGKRNPKWEKNSDFANMIHSELEQLHPGISRGIYGKSSHGNAEYNQSLFENSILMEIGGPYNTLEEMYRTADLLANLIADIYWNAEKVDAPVTAP